MKCEICGNDVEHPEYGTKCNKCLYESDWEYDT